MKELSIEEKVNRYDEAIKKAESLYKVAEPMSGCNVILETIFPELKESEDERIRKNFCKDIWNYIPYEKAHKYITWLEKQGEKKSSWSQEDEQYLLVCKNALVKYQTTDKWDANIIYNWLKNKLQKL